MWAMLKCLLPFLTVIATIGTLGLIYGRLRSAVVLKIWHLKITLEWPNYLPITTGVVAAIAFAIFQFPFLLGIASGGFGMFVLDKAVIRGLKIAGQKLIVLPPDDRLPPGKL